MMVEWTTSEYLDLIGIVLSAFVAMGIYLLQQKLTDKQRVDHRLEIEEKVGKKLYEINYHSHPRKIQLYNAKLLNKRYFTQNKRSFWWGYPFHAAELYAANFDGLEFIVGIEEWKGQKYYQAGVIPYERVLGIRPEGDGSFNGLIIYVRPRLLQRDKYSIAYKSYRYYPVKGSSLNARKPWQIRLSDGLKKIARQLRYNFYYSWKHRLQNRRNGRLPY
jgi:hypothetical protein